jgi:hypothetical protein
MFNIFVGPLVVDVPRDMSVDQRYSEAVVLMAMVMVGDSGGSCRQRRNCRLVQATGGSN